MGVVVGLTQAPQQITLYELKAYLTAGAATYIKTINIIAYDDAAIMHSQITSPGVQNVLNTLHVSLYGDSLNEYYKADLLSLVGQLDFSAEPSSIGLV